MKKNKWLLWIFVITIVISIILFVNGKGYEGMFNSFKEEPIDTTTIEFVEEPIIDTILIYRVIVGSFKIDENANKFSESVPFSDIIIKNGYFMVSKSYYFNIEDAIIEKDSLGNSAWVLKDFIFIGK